MAYFQGEMPWRVIGSVREGEAFDPNSPFIKRADAVYECKHMTLYYRLDSGKADEYYLPPVVCVNCKTHMQLVELFKERKPYV